MSKILCTLAFYHDGGTFKPQLTFSTNPATNLVMRGTDWKNAKISNTNASSGARNRFEYSFTGGKSVTRCSIVMNTSAILPPFLWLSKHPCGPPTETSSRAKPGSKEHQEHLGKIEREKQRLAAKAEMKAIESGRGRSSIPKDEREAMLEEHGVFDEDDPLKRLESHSQSLRSYNERQRYPEEERYQIQDRYSSREERQRQVRGEAAVSSTVVAAALASSSVSPPEYLYEDPYAGIPDRDTRRQQRLKRLQSSSSASESSDSGAGSGSGERYRRSSRGGGGRSQESPYSSHHRRHHKRYHGGEYASG